jgi:hypothetical protein
VHAGYQLFMKIGLQIFNGMLFPIENTPHEHMLFPCPSLPQACAMTRCGSSSCTRLRVSERLCVYSIQLGVTSAGCMPP